VRILAYACAGGYDGPSLEGKTFFLDMTARRRLLARGMANARARDHHRHARDGRLAVSIRVPEPRHPSWWAWRRH
jgi:hypothetical protein